uniref:hypothetical protein n=1 Tax=Streptococcus suis TaxID=1307 RepID=UPI001E63958A
LRKSNEYAINTLYHKCTVFVSFNYTKLEPVPLPLNISSTIEHRTYRQRNSAEGKILLSYGEDIAVLNHFYRTLLKREKSNYKKDSPKTTRKAYC